MIGFTRCIASTEGDERRTPAASHAPSRGARARGRYRPRRGYFKRKLDRGRSRELIRRLEASFAADPANDVQWEVVPPSPPTQRCYLRFACAETDPSSGRRTGMFQAAYDLLHDDELDDVSKELLADAVGWFEKHLPVPHGFRDARAIFLFKSTAPVCMGKVWELVRLLRDHGVTCEMQTFRDPGRIVFQDRYQIAVIPSAGPSSL